MKHSFDVNVGHSCFNLFGIFTIWTEHVAWGYAEWFNLFCIIVHGEQSPFFFAFFFDMHVWSSKVLKDGYSKLVFVFFLNSHKLWMIFCKRLRRSEESFSEGLDLDPTPFFFVIIVFILCLFFVRFNAELEIVRCNEN